MKNLIRSILIVSTLVVLTACSKAETNPTATVETPEMEAPTATLPPTETPAPTETPLPTPTITPEPTATKQQLYSESLTITTADGVDLSAKILGDGDVAVIMLHMVADNNNKLGSKNDWLPIALPAARAGYTVLTLDFRAFGDSGGSRTYSDMWQDVQAAIELLQERGHENIVCMGASLGGATCLWAGANYDLAGLIIIASPMDMGLPNGITDEDFPALTEKKLFIVSEFDNGDVVEPMAYMFDNSPEPKDFFVYEGLTAHGTELFGSVVKEEFKQDILDFLEQIP